MFAVGKTKLYPLLFLSFLGMVASLIGLPPKLLFKPVLEDNSEKKISARDLANIHIRNFSEEANGANNIDQTFRGVTLAISERESSKPAVTIPLGPHETISNIDLSEQTLQNQIAAAKEDKDFWKSRQAWLISLGKIIHAHPANKEIVLNEVSQLSIAADDAVQDWSQERSDYESQSELISQQQSTLLALLDAYNQTIEAAQEVKKRCHLLTQANLDSLSSLNPTFDQVSEIKSQRISIIGNQNLLKPDQNDASKLSCFASWKTHSMPSLNSALLKTLMTTALLHGFTRAEEECSTPEKNNQHAYTVCKFIYDNIPLLDCSAFSDRFCFHYPILTSSAAIGSVPALVVIGILGKHYCDKYYPAIEEKVLGIVGRLFQAEKNVEQPKQLLTDITKTIQLLAQAKIDCFSLINYLSKKRLLSAEIKGERLDFTFAQYDFSECDGKGKDLINYCNYLNKIKEYWNRVLQLQSSDSESALALYNIALSAEETAIYWGKYDAASSIISIIFNDPEVEKYKANALSLKDRDENAIKKIESTVSKNSIAMLTQDLVNTYSTKLIEIKRQLSQTKKFSLNMRWHVINQSFVSKNDHCGSGIRTNGIESLERGCSFWDKIISIQDSKDKTLEHDWIELALAEEQVAGFWYHALSDRSYRSHYKNIAYSLQDRSICLEKRIEHLNSANSNARQENKEVSERYIAAAEKMKFAAQYYLQAAKCYEKDNINEGICYKGAAASTKKNAEYFLKLKELSIEEKEVFNFKEAFYSSQLAAETYIKAAEQYKNGNINNGNINNGNILKNNAKSQQSTADSLASPNKGWCLIN